MAFPPKRRGFTLIELLVVIAIIAILAAILFPVFAQAREKARAIACLSNTRQIATGIYQYVQDYDETYPLFAAGLGNASRIPNPLDPTCQTQECKTLQNPKGVHSMWMNEIYPYVKNWNIFFCPDANTNDGAGPVTRYYNITYGYNYGNFSSLVATADPGDPGVNQYFAGVTLASIRRPADTFVVTDNGGNDFTGPQYIGSMVNPPDAYTSDRYYYGPSGVGWGKGCGTYFAQSQGLVSSGKWGDTDGFANRHQDGANICLADGHAKFYHLGAAAEGSTWNAGADCSTVTVNDYSKYHWDPRYDSGTTANHQ